MRYGAFLLAILLITPFSASAAGFAKQSLFLSKSPVTEGETVFIHAVVNNDSDTEFTGEVVFKDGETKIGAVSVTLPAGGADATSVSWKPVSGSHTITAELTGPDGTVAESESTKFDIKSAPKPETEAVDSTSSSTVESSAKIKETVAGISPQAADAATPVFSAIDSLRQKSVDALDAGETWAKDKAGKGEVAGASTGPGGMAGTIMQVVANLLIYLISALKWIVSNAGVFYPVLAFAFFYVLWRLYKRMRRPA